LFLELCQAKEDMKYKAVIFDLGGTLARSTTWSAYVDSARKMAAILSADEEDFVKLWFEQSSGLGTGVYPSYQSYIKHLCDQLDLDPPDNVIELAAIVPFSVIKNDVMEPRDDSIEVLAHLKAKGYKTGLISDCGPELPVFWEETPFARLIDVAVFSCVAGMNKGDPRIFKIALEKLAVRPEECIYVADGMRNELANAAGLGMTAMQLLVPGEIDESPIREDWHGLVIASLKEVLNLL
jgi:putative hydrolase of the HAD superfamily